MDRFFVPFRMHSTGWLLCAMCGSIGLWLGGWRLGFLIGVSLLASLLLHEVGHILAARLLWVPVREFGLRLGGAYNRRAFASRRRDEILISAAGPLMNLLLVVPVLFIPRIGAQLGLGNLALCVVNLLPIPSSDGLRILRAVWYSERPGSAIPAAGGD